MNELTLTAAFSCSDSILPLLTQQVRPGHINLRIVTDTPSNIFAEMCERQPFHIAEMSMGAYLHLVATSSRDTCPFVGIPAFLSRAWRHSMVYANTAAGVSSIADLNGKRIAIREWGMTALVWIVGILEDEYGFEPASVEWVAAKPPRARIAPPAGTRLRYMEAGETLSALLDSGGVDGALIHQAPACYVEGSPRVKRLFDDPAAAELDYFDRTGIVPIMHCVVIRRDVIDADPWVASSMLAAMAEAKQVAMAALEDTGHLSAMLPTLPHAVADARRRLGDDWWPYGLAANAVTLEALARYAHRQGLTPAEVAIEDMFHPDARELAATG